MPMEHAKRTYKDGLFRFYMREPENSLALCRTFTHMNLSPEDIREEAQRPFPLPAGADVFFFRAPEYPEREYAREDAAVSGCRLRIHPAGGLHLPGEAIPLSGTKILYAVQREGAFPRQESITAIRCVPYGRGCGACRHGIQHQLQRTKQDSSGMPSFA